MREDEAGGGCGSVEVHDGADGQDPLVSLTDLVVRLGGVATRAELDRAGVARRTLDRALREDTLRRSSRGRYAVPDAAAHRAVAHQLHGTLSHASAAIHHGWKVKTVPETAQVIVRRDRRLRGEHPSDVTIRFRDVARHELRDGVTTPLRTVVDCARDLAFPDALTIADSALREKHVDQAALRRLAAALVGPGSAKVRRVAKHASPRAANPFESVLRALAIECGLDARAQVQVVEPGLFATVDVGVEELRLALEADSFEFHADRRSLRRDIHRYDVLVVFGWTVLRFSWEHVMQHPEFVLWALRSWLGSQLGTVPPPPPVLPRWH